MSSSVSIVWYDGFDESSKLEDNDLDHNNAPYVDDDDDLVGCCSSNNGIDDDDEGDATVAAAVVGVLGVGGVDGGIVLAAIIITTTMTTNATSMIDIPICIIYSSICAICSYVYGSIVNNNAIPNVDMMFQSIMPIIKPGDFNVAVVMGVVVVFRVAMIISVVLLLLLLLLHVVWYRTTASIRVNKNVLQKDTKWNDK